MHRGLAGKRGSGAGSEESQPCLARQAPQGANHGVSVAGMDEGVADSENLRVSMSPDV